MQGATLWLYQLLQKHLLICGTKLHYIDLYGPLLSLSHIDIWYLVSNNPEICQKSWKMTYRKKGKIFRDGSNCPIIWWINSKKIIIWYKRVLSKGDKGLKWINWWKLTVTVCFESNFMWKSNVLEIYASENVSLWANPKNLSFFSICHFSTCLAYCWVVWHQISNVYMWQWH